MKYIKGINHMDLIMMKSIIYLPTENWLTFQVPQNEDIPPSMYWRFVVKTLYGDNSCRCGLDQIKITCTL